MHCTVVRQCMCQCVGVASVETCLCVAQNMQQTGSCVAAVDESIQFTLYFKNTELGEKKKKK